MADEFEVPGEPAHELRHAEIPRIDLNWFPAALQSRVQYVAATVGCDPVVPLFAGLAVICGAVDSRTRLRLLDGYEVPPILWLMTIGSPADKKTPGSGPMVDVLHKLESEDLPAWKKRMLVWEAQEARYNALKKKFLEQAGEGKDSLPEVPELGPQPQPLRIKISDITSQKLVRYSAERPRGLLCFLDEMNGWIKKISDRTSIEDRSAWVQAYEGRRYEFDRVGGGTIIAEAFAVSIYGNVQPQVYAHAVDSLSADGLLQRFVPGLLDSRHTKRGEPQRGHQESAHQWEAAIRMVYSLQPMTYALSEEAYKVFREWQNWFEAHKQAEIITEAPDGYLTAYGKLEGLSARIALVMHVIDAPFSGTVSAQTMQRAIDFVKYYVMPAHQYLQYKASKAEPLSAWVADWLLYHSGLRDRVTLSDVKRSARRRVEHIKDIWLQDNLIIEAMQALERAHWVKRLDDGSREHLHFAEWEINPSLESHLRDRRRKLILARQMAEDHRRFLAGLERRIIPGYIPEEMDDEIQTRYKRASPTDEMAPA